MTPVQLAANLADVEDRLSCINGDLLLLSLFLGRVFGIARF